MIASKFFKVIFKSQFLRCQNPKINNLFGQVPVMSFSSDINETQKKQQEESPFEISESRQHMISNKNYENKENSHMNYKSNKPHYRKERREGQQNYEKSEFDNRREQKYSYQQIDKSGENIRGERRQNNQNQIRNERNNRYSYQNRGNMRILDSNQEKLELSSENFETYLPNLKSVFEYTEILNRVTNENLMKVLQDEQIINNANNVIALNNILTYLRKNNVCELSEIPEFKQIVKTISENLDKLENTSNVSVFSLNLFKGNFSEVEPFVLIEKFTLQNINEYALRDLAQICFTFCDISRLSDQHNFTHFYHEMIPQITMKLKSELESASKETVFIQKDFSQILQGYSKSQNFTNEFLQFLEQIVIQYKNNLNPRQKITALNTFALNNYPTQQTADLLKEDFLNSPKSYSTQDLSHFIVVLDKINLINEEVMQVSIKQFMRNQSSLNKYDLSDFCQVFFKREYVDENFMFTAETLYNQLDCGSDLRLVNKMLTNVSNLLNKELMNQRFFEEILASLKFYSNKRPLSSKFIDILNEDALKIQDPELKQQYLDILESHKRQNLKRTKRPQ